MSGPLNGYTKLYALVAAVVGSIALALLLSRGPHEAKYRTRGYEAMAEIDSIANGWPTLIVRMDTLESRVEQLEAKVDSVVRERIEAGE